MRNIVRLMSGFIIYATLIKQACAVCPVCTFVAVSGLGLDRYLGVDDVYSGIWLGGLILSSALWTNDILRRRNISYPFRRLSIIISCYLIFILPLYWAQFIGAEGNTLWGYDKIVVGVAAGSIAFLFGVFIDIALRASNNCKVYFYFQKIILPISCLLIASGIFYFILH